MTKFGITVSTSLGTRQLTDLVLNGRESKVVVTDYLFGSSRALYSTAAILFSGKLNGKDVLYFYGDLGATQEVALKLTKELAQGKTTSDSGENAVSLAELGGGYTTVKYSPKKKGLSVILETDKYLILASDTATAQSFWSPVVSGSGSQFPSYWQFGSNSTVLVGGPYLVRSVTIKGSKLDIVGDLENDTTLTVVGAPRSVKTITFNGRAVTLRASGLGALDSILVGSITQLSAAKTSLKLPELQSGWKYADSLPEVLPSYSDAKWVVANKTTTNSPWKPYYGDEGGPVLYGCDYGL